jgi:hypothetical protein
LVDTCYSIGYNVTAQCEPLWYAGAWTPVTKWSLLMAKKASGAKQMSATATPTRKRTGIAVRLDLAPEDHERLTKLAKDQGLSLSSYARMALFKQMKADEGGGK